MIKKNIGTIKIEEIVSYCSESNTVELKLKKSKKFNLTTLQNFKCKVIDAFTWFP